MGQPGANTEVPVVFENAAGGPALPEPQPQESAPGDPNPAPPTPELPDAPPTPEPPQPAPPMPAPPLPEPPQPRPLAETPPPPAAPPTPEPPQPEPPAALPRQEPIPTPQPPVEAPQPLPEPPPPVAELQPEALPPSDSAELILPPPPPPAPPPATAQPRPRTAPASPFPGTLDLSRQPPIALRPPPPRGGVPRQSLPPGALDLSMGRVPEQRRAPADMQSDSSMSHVAGAQASGSWAGAFRDWVNRRKFYPRQAAMNGEDGAVKVRVVIERSGRVRSVQLVGRSGSTWLDSGLLSLFRDQMVPAFTPEMEGDTMTLDFTMHYILIYR